MTTRFACAVLLTSSLAACGDDGGTTKTPDAAASVPAHITVSGTTKQIGTSGSSPLGGVTVAAYSNTDEATVVAMATSDQNGAYSLDVTTGGKALDGYIKATLSGYLDTYLYAPAPLSADYDGAAMNLVTEQTFQLLSTVCGHGITSAMGAVGVEIVDGTGAVVSGAAMSSTPAPGKYCYNGSNGLPDSAATTTNADGLGYLVEITGSVDVTGTKSGLTFGTHKINVRAGALTTTLVAGQ